MKYIFIVIVIVLIGVILNCIFSICAKLSEIKQLLIEIEQLLHGISSQNVGINDKLNVIMKSDFQELEFVNMQHPRS